MPVQEVSVTLESADKLDKDCLLISKLDNVVSTEENTFKAQLKIRKEKTETKFKGALEDLPSSTEAKIDDEHENKNILEKTYMGSKTAINIEGHSISKGENDQQKRLLSKEAEKVKKEQFYHHLQNLLSRSQFYSKLLIKKIKRHKMEKEKIEAKILEFNKQKELENKMVIDQMELETPPVKRRRGRKLLSPKELEIIAPVIAEVSLDNTETSRQPKTFIGQMRDYQLDGMEWLSVLYDNGINGVLADEMGLGKTIQVIALFARLMEKNVPGPYLVSAPLSTLGNWQNEFKRFTPHIKTIVYQGSKFNRSSMLDSIRSETVLITSYEIVMRDRVLLARNKWRYIVVDEGHRMKNPDCKFVRELKLYPALNRLLLTGTPLQNNLIELWSLLNFLMPDLFDDLKVFESWFDVSAMQEEGSNAEIIAQEREKHIIATLHQILTPFLLRRTKAEVKLDIPPKKEVLIYARMSALEERYYKASLNKTIEKLLGVEKKGTANDSLEDINGVRKKRKSTESVNYTEYLTENSDDSLDDLQASFSQNTSVKAESPVKPKITSEIRLKLGSIIMHLKKIVTHPYLLDYPLTPEGEYLINENLINNSGKMRILDSLLQGLKKGGHKVLIFSQFTILLDILHDYCVYRSYNFVRLDGRMAMEERDQNIKAFNKDEDIFIFLLSTRAGGLGLNLTSADTVIIYDSDWNPQCDLQAQDRCHRYGQTKPVMVYRLVTGNSIDEKVVDRAHAKRKLEKMIMMKGRFSGNDSKKSKGDKDLIVEHLEDLLKNMDKQEKVLPQDGEVFTKQQLTMLLDRSGKALEKVSDNDSCFKVINTNLGEEEDI